jgi:hypothetical protein
VGMEETFDSERATREPELDKGLMENEHSCWDGRICSFMGSSYSSNTRTRRWYFQVELDSTLFLGTGGEDPYWIYMLEI